MSESEPTDRTNLMGAMQKMAAVVRARKAASPRYADRPESLAEEEELMPGLQKLQAIARPSYHNSEKPEKVLRAKEEA